MLNGFRCPDWQIFGPIDIAGPLSFILNHHLYTEDYLHHSIALKYVCCVLGLYRDLIRPDRAPAAVTIDWLPRSAQPIR